MRITWHGHSFFELETAPGTTVLVDPFLDENPFTDLTPSDFDPDIVAVTHGDYFDHAGDAHRLSGTIVCQSVAANAYRALGHDDVVDMNVGGTYERADVTFTMTHGHHSIGSGRPDDLVVRFDEFPKTKEFGGVASGFVIDDGETRFFHAGDTGLFGDLRTVIGDVYQPDIAAVPIGDHYTMGPEYAATAVDWLGVEAALPMHYDTFPQIEVDPQAFVDAVDDAEVFVPESGESITWSPVDGR